MEVSNAMNAPANVRPSVYFVNKTHARCVSWRGELNSWPRRSKSSSHYQNGFGIIVEDGVHNFL